MSSVFHVWLSRQPSFSVTIPEIAIPWSTSPRAANLCSDGASTQLWGCCKSVDISFERINWYKTKNRAEVTDQSITLVIVFSRKCCCLPIAILCFKNPEISTQIFYANDQNIIPIFLLLNVLQTARDIFLVFLWENVFLLLWNSVIPIHFALFVSSLKQWDKYIYIYRVIYVCMSFTEMWGIYGVVYLISTGR